MTRAKAHLPPRNRRNPICGCRTTATPWPKEWKQADIYRAVIHELPRLFHSLDQAAQRQAIADAPTLTGTRWDALIAATVEHVARLHDQAIPAWVEEPERFLDEPWVVATLPLIRYESLAFAPGAFIRHGALPDPRDLDARGGERHAWAP